MGGKPSKGTSADKRLGRNKTGNGSTGNGSTPAPAPSRK